MKKPMLKLLVVTCGVMLLVGCRSIRDEVPATQFSVFLNGKPASFSGPKDLTAESITFTAKTNGEVSLAIVGLSAKTNPDVITMTGAAQAAIIKANGDAITQGINAGAAIAGTLAAKAGKTALAP